MFGLYLKVSKSSIFVCFSVSFFLTSLFPTEERHNATTLYNPTTLGELPTLEGLPPSWTDYVWTLFEG
jgi:hypothetical protein